MKKKVLSLVLALALCLSSVLCLSAASAESSAAAGVLSFLNYSEDEFAQASVVWNYLALRCMPTAMSNPRSSFRRTRRRF